MLAAKMCFEKFAAGRMSTDAVFDPKWAKYTCKLYCFSKEAEEMAADLRVLGEEDNVQNQLVL